jgi:D-amino-acid dehydrogenase
MKEITIIGGGIIGMCTAFYLQQEGHQVTIIDASDLTSGASYVNAGYISPSHFVPLSSPGIISKGLKWMLNSSSPFYVKPRLDPEFLRWAWYFKRSATLEKVERAIPVLKDINLLSRELFEDMKESGILNFHYERKGLLMCYKTDKVGEEEWEVGQRGIREGLHVHHLGKDELKTVEPDVDLNIKGAVYYESDAHMTPGVFMDEIKKYLESKGVRILPNEGVIDLEVSHGKITDILTNRRTMPVEEVVLAAGSWSPLIARKTGLSIPLQAGKGYRINVFRETKITVPAILCEAKVAVTPMRGFTRFAGTMEIGGINHVIRSNRVNAIAMAAERYYQGLEIDENEKRDAQCGLRPCTPDGIPYIGKSSKCENLVLATGHAMLGWSLGPATGKLVSEIVSGKSPSMDIQSFHPDRKF